MIIGGCGKKKKDKRDVWWCLTLQTEVDLVY